MYYGCIYKVTNIENNKCYIGQTASKNPVYYIKNHFKCALKNKDKNKKNFYKAIRKYGEKNFKWEILGYCSSLEELNLAEELCIEFFKSNNYIYGYNMTSGPTTRITELSNYEDIIKRMVENRRKLDNYGTGRKMPKEFGEDLSVKLSGLKRTKEQNEKNSLVHKGLQVGEKNGFYRKKHTPETLKIIGEKSRTIPKKRVKGNPFKNSNYIEMYGPIKAARLIEEKSLARKNKTFVDLFGEERAKEIIEKRRKKIKGREPHNKIKIDLNSLYFQYFKLISVKQIAKNLNINYTVVWNRLKSLNIPTDSISKKGKIERLNYICENIRI